MDCRGVSDENTSVGLDGAEEGQPATRKLWLPPTRQKDNEFTHVESKKGGNE